MTIYYSFCDAYQDPMEHISDYEFKTKDDAIDYAQSVFSEECAASGEYSDGDTHDQEITVFKVDPESDNPILETDEVVVEYVHYHGDFAEHNLYYKGGVL